MRHRAATCGRRRSSPASTFAPAPPSWPDAAWPAAAPASPSVDRRRRLLDLGLDGLVRRLPRHPLEAGQRQLDAPPGRRAPGRRTDAGSPFASTSRADRGGGSAMRRQRDVAAGVADQDEGAVDAKLSTSPSTVAPGWWSAMNWMNVSGSLTRHRARPPSPPPRHRRRSPASAHGRRAGPPPPSCPCRPDGGACACCRHRSPSALGVATTSAPVTASSTPPRWPTSAPHRHAGLVESPPLASLSSATGRRRLRHRHRRRASFDAVPCPAWPPSPPPATSGPRTGVRGTKIQPTPGTGLPPISRPSSNSQAYSPWNSWNESFESTTASALSAICRRKASPRPIAPAGGVDQLAVGGRLLVQRALRRVDAMAERRVDDDGDRRRPGSRRERAHSLVELREARQRATFGRDVRAVDDDLVG